MTGILAGCAVTAAVLTLTVLHQHVEVRYQRRHISSLETAVDEWQKAYCTLRDEVQQATADAHWLDQLEQHANGGGGEHR